MQLGKPRLWSHWPLDQVCTGMELSLLEPRRLDLPPQWLAKTRIMTIYNKKVSQASWCFLFFFYWLLYMFLRSLYRPLASDSDIVGIRLKHWDDLLTFFCCNVGKRSVVVLSWETGEKKSLWPWASHSTCQASLFQSIGQLYWINSVSQWDLLWGQFLVKCDLLT